MANQVDLAIKATAYILGDKEVVYIGLNSFLPYFAVYLARRMGRDLTVVGVAEGIEPCFRVKPSSGDPEFVANSPILPTTDAFDLVQKGRIDVMFLGPAQIDKETNVNLTAINSYERPKVRLPGGAATAFILPLVKKAVLWNLKHSRRTLVPRVDFITGTAKNSNNRVYLVTDMALMEFRRDLGVWELRGVYAETTVEKVKENTGFPLVVEDPMTIEVTGEEVDFLNSLDPQGFRYSLRI